jgi:hypothetical protein
MCPEINTSRAVVMGSFLRGEPDGYFLLSPWMVKANVGHASGQWMLALMQACLIADKYFCIDSLSTNRQE